MLILGISKLWDPLLLYPQLSCGFALVYKFLSAELKVMCRDINELPVFSTRTLNILFNVLHKTAEVSQVVYGSCHNFSAV